MIHSMTGYGRASAIESGREITVELRAVNHRYFEASVRCPRAYAWLEDKTKQLVQGRVSRGKMDINLTIANIDVEDTVVGLNLGLARGYVEALKRAAGELGLDDNVDTSTLSRFPDIFTVNRARVDEDRLWAEVSLVAGQALQRFDEMRQAEGLKLAQDVTRRIETLVGLLGLMEESTPDRLEKYRQKLTMRMKTVLENTELDESRILLEAALYADKSCFDEETVRLRSHLAQFLDILKSDEPIGRKLDFLVQEMNREANTIGSKAGDLEITSLVVDMKAEIEKIREQIQNIE